MPRPLDECGPDTDWGEAQELRSTLVLSTAMVDALRRLQPDDGAAPELLEVVACCLRLRESLLLTIAVDGWIWPVTLHPQCGLYKAPIDWLHAPPSGLWAARLVACEPPHGEPPRRHAESRRALPPCHYPLGELLWTLALLGPRNAPLRALAAGERFRALGGGRPETASVRLPGALGSALARLRAGPAGFETICRWPGLDAARAARLLNGLYLEGRLVTDDGPIDADARDSAWSDTQPSRWPPRGTGVRPSPAWRAARNS
ncbi:hypothetical protein [Piscinibacter sp.]|uniref:hypothetical protein n=1 Tax=Piscinibacter sp. TaxID=1903157 RepID=UPI0039E4E33E